MLLILDEVMSGMGRTGRLFACEEDGVAPDLVAIAKGLGGGYQPIGAVLCADRVYEAIVGGSGFFQHGHTYIGHAIACAAALAVMRTIEDEGLLRQVRDKGRALREALARAFGDHPHVGDIRGRGLFVGVELVEDRRTQGAVRSRAGAARAGQGGSLRARADGLSAGRDRRRPQRRPHPARPAVHRQRGARSRRSSRGSAAAVAAALA